MWNEFKNIVEIDYDKFIPKVHTFDSWKKWDGNVDLQSKLEI